MMGTRRDPGTRRLQVVPAPVAIGAGKTAGEDATIEVAAKLPLHMFRHRPLVIAAPAAVGEPSLEVLPDGAILPGFVALDRIQRGRFLTGPGESSGVLQPQLAKGLGGAAQGPSQRVRRGTAYRPSPKSMPASPS